MEQQNLKPWESRIFLIGVVVLVCLTVLVSTDKLAMDAGTLTTVFLGVLAVVAGITRRGSELQPGGSPLMNRGDINAVLSGLGPALSGRLNPTVSPVNLDDLPQVIPGQSAEDYRSALIGPTGAVEPSSPLETPDGVSNGDDDNGGSAPPEGLH